MSNHGTGEYFISFDGTGLVGGGGVNTSRGFLKANEPGSPGRGGKAGKGGKGGILLYYRVPKPIRSGRFLARGGVPFQGKGGQTIAV